MHRSLHGLETFLSVNTPFGWITLSSVGLSGLEHEAGVKPLKPLRSNVVPCAGSSRAATGQEASATGLSRSTSPPS